jgi:hypothetical protein
MAYSKGSNKKSGKKASKKLMSPRKQMASKIKKSRNTKKGY